MTENPELFRTAPAVFAVGDSYQIMVPVNAQALFCVEVGGECYYDHANGIMRSDTDLHRVEVPREALDRAGCYTTVYRKIIDRSPYYPKTEDAVRTTYDFTPVNPEKETIRFYHLADVHGNPKPAIRAGGYFGDKLDFLLLNGDVIDHSGDTKNFSVIYEICDALTHGEKPVICSRGNHDLRGFCAERIRDYTPNRNGKTYYTARLGGFWFLVLDCAEDKADTSPEYGFTVACHPFRKEQTDFLRSVIADAEREYAAPGITRRFVLVHSPFTHIQPHPFDIEQDIYREWARLIGEHIHPDLFLCGHMHESEVYPVGGSHDDLGQCCPVAVAAEPHGDNFIGGAFTVTKDQITLEMTDSDGNAGKTYAF